MYIRYYPFDYNDFDYHSIVERRVRIAERLLPAQVYTENLFLKNYFLAYQDGRSLERAGILAGEYIILGNGLGLIKHDGTIIRANINGDDAIANSFVKDQLDSATDEVVKQMLATWNDILLVDRPIILSDIWSDNYFHFTVDLMPRLRLIADVQERRICMPTTAMGRPFQRSLFELLHPGAAAFVFPSSFRVRDPVLSYGQMTRDGLLWLRDRAALTVRSGERRLYIRRSGRGTRSDQGGGLIESEDFLRLIASFGFEPIEFGTGDRSIEQQISQLEGVAVILAAHGAALTNMTYLEGPIRLVEIVGQGTSRACYGQIAAMLGFDYRAILSEHQDGAGNIHVACDILRQVFGDMGLRAVG